MKKYFESEKYCVKKVRLFNFAMLASDIETPILNYRGHQRPLSFHPMLDGEGRLHVVKKVEE